jgi:thiamine transporter ThiT
MLPKHTLHFISEIKTASAKQYSKTAVISTGITVFCFAKGISMKTRSKLFKMCLAALFMALAYVLPFMTGHVPLIGTMLCPMHLPVLLCGFICGWPWGLAIGLTAPIFRALTLGYPVLFPNAVSMAFELAAYGLVAGFMHRILPKRKICIYFSLITAMIVGRLVWGAMMFLCTGIRGGSFTLTAFLSGALLNAVPGIIVQIVLVPILVMVLDNPKVLKLNG